MTLIEEIERDLCIAVSASKARKTAIWRELNTMIATQEDRADAEQVLRAAEHAREMELRAKLNTIEGTDDGDLPW